MYVYTFNAQLCNNLTTQPFHIDVSLLDLSSVKRIASTWESGKFDQWNRKRQTRIFILNFIIPFLQAWVLGWIWTAAQQDKGDIFVPRSTAYATQPRFLGSYNTS